jgi:hypothetical protein
VMIRPISSMCAIRAKLAVAVAPRTSAIAVASFV